MMAAAGAALLGGCASVPEQRGVAPVVALAVEKQYPAYRWTTGLAPKAHDEATALFGPLALRPGDSRWVDTIPATGEARVIIDLRTQLLYVYRDTQLVGVSTISSG